MQVRQVQIIVSKIKIPEEFGKKNILMDSTISNKRLKFSLLKSRVSKNLSKVNLFPVKGSKRIFEEENKASISDPVGVTADTSQLI